MLRYGHGAGGVHLTRYTTNITGKEHRKLIKERMAKQREDAKINLNNGPSCYDGRIINLKNKIKNLQTSIRQLKKNNNKKPHFRNEAKIKQKQIQIKKLNEQLKEVNSAVKKISYHKKIDKKGNVIEEIIDEYGYKRTKKNGHVVKIEKILNKNKKTDNDKSSISSKVQNNKAGKGLTNQEKSKKYKKSTRENIDYRLKQESDNKSSIKNSSQNSSSNNKSAKVIQKQICKDCVFMELITLQCRVIHNSCIGKKCSKYKKSRGLYAIVQ